MNLATSTYQHLKRLISRKFLLIFSILSISVGGIVWACSDYGYDTNYSSFSPEAFVAPQYTPFFFEEYLTYYGEANFSDNNNRRFNDQVLNDWYSYLEQKVSKADLEYLLFKTSYKGIDSVYNHLKGKITALPDSMPHLTKLNLNKKLAGNFFDYLLLAKSCEVFAATYEPYYWDEKPAAPAPLALEKTLLTAFDQSKDTFVKQRLWFQLVRYYYFLENKQSKNTLANSKTIKAFDTYKETSPKNMIYYRALGYVAGRYYTSGDYGTSNYLNSLCYDYAHEMKIPVKWSFHPQEEADWKKTLALAKTKEEKTTLWHLLGIYYDTDRAITQIVALDPKSDKLDLLLSRVVNLTENQLANQPGAETQALLKKNTALVSGIASKNNTAKPYFWNLAAGYLSSLNKNYTAAAGFYNTAKTQLPKNDKLLMAQYKLLDWELYINQLKTIDAKAEAHMVEPLNWFSKLQKGTDSISGLRFEKSLNNSLDVISKIYKKQGNPLKAVAFKTYTDFYKDNNQIEQLKTLLLKPKKTAFEKTMLQYYPYKIEELYFQQAITLVYQERLSEAIVMLEKYGSFELQGNPFNMRLNDCHDCDHQMHQSKKISSMSLLRMMKNLETELKAGRNVYNNANLLANAYYNITHYGNARTFYVSRLNESDVCSPDMIPEAFQPMLLSSKIAEKYYLMARDAAQTKEQKAKCIFMAAKCERNESYNRTYALDNLHKNDPKWNMDLKEMYFGKYFATLKQQYSDTKFYKEALKECGYFRTYASKAR